MQFIHDLKRSWYSCIIKIKIDGDKYIVDCSFDDLDKNKTKDCLKYLEEFNEVNKFTPIKIK